MKIAIIGPVYPFRGGIAHSNTLLCGNLGKNHEVYPISFKRQFPKLLFPGREQKYEAKKKLSFKTEFIVDSVNPYTWLKTFSRIKKFDPKLVILQWWTPFFTPFSYTLLSLLRLFTEAKICIVCANVTQHEDRLIDRVLTMMVFRKSHYFIALADGDLKKLHKWYPEAKTKVLIEPTFESVFGLGTISKQEAKRKLGLKKKTLLFFGFVRKYKGLMFLLEAMPKILKKLDVDLLIAGEFWSDKKEYLDKIDKLKIKDNVKIVDKYIPDEDVSLYFSAADIVLLPYLDASQSGIVQVAYGALRPVISTNVGAIDDFVDDGKTGYIIPPKDPKAIADVVIRFYKSKKEKDFEKNIKEKKKIFEWSKEKEDILFFGLHEKS